MLFKYVIIAFSWTNHVAASSEFYAVEHIIAFTKQRAWHIKRNFKVNFPEYLDNYWFAKTFDVFDANLIYICPCIFVYA